MRALESDAQQAVAFGAAFGSKACTAVGFAWFFEKLAASHFFFDAAALDQLAKAANRLLNAFSVANGELNHTFPRAIEGAKYEARILAIRGSRVYGGSLSRECLEECCCWKAESPE